MTFLDTAFYLYLSNGGREALYVIVALAILATLYREVFGQFFTT